MHAPHPLISQRVKGICRVEGEEERRGRRALPLFSPPQGSLAADPGRARGFESALRLFVCRPPPSLTASLPPPPPQAPLRAT